MKSTCSLPLLATLALSFLSMASSAPTLKSSTRAPFSDPLVSVSSSGPKAAGSNQRNFIIPNETGPAAWSCIYMKSSVQAPAGPSTGTVISIDRNSGEKPFACGELISREINLDYGTYAVDMISTAYRGHVTALFLIAPNGAAEIDVELTGLNSKIAHLNVWKDGRQNPVIVPLGFDASQDWHRYEIEWRENFIAWTIDGKQVLKVTTEAAQLVAPSKTPYKLVLNSWTNNGDDHWAGKFAWPAGKNVKVESHFRNLTYTP